ncbi:hypothetical protein HYV79_03870 [Candidatus Woesearchaeota archaeon]|nr:hypothetical protein [Candidatus Woesearchaeota archaeon]
MGLAGFVFTLVLLLFNLLTSIRLANRLTTNVTLELVFLVIGVLLWLIALLGFALNKRWGWNWNIILFSLSLANLIWLYSLFGSSLTHAFAFFVNSFGLLVSILGLDLYVPPSTDDSNLEELKSEQSLSVTKKKTRSKKKLNE